MAKLEFVDFRAFLEYAQKLPVEQKIELISVLFSPPLQVVISESGQLASNFIMLINNPDRQLMSDLLEIISNKLLSK